MTITIKHPRAPGQLQREVIASDGASIGYVVRGKFYAAYWWFIPLISDYVDAQGMTISAPTMTLLRARIVSAYAGYCEYCHRLLHP